MESIFLLPDLDKKTFSDHMGQTSDMVLAV